MAYLIDTSIVGRLANTGDASHVLALQAVAKLHAAGESLHITPQNLIEFRNFATGPAAVNGLGLAPADAEVLAAGFEAAFVLVPETPAIYPAWKAVVRGAAATGKQVHDARLVAICQVNGIAHLLTF